jgi:subtilisin family serine protease
MRKRGVRRWICGCIGALALFATAAPAWADSGGGGGSGGRPNTLTPQDEPDAPSWVEEPGGGPPPFFRDGEAWGRPAFGWEAPSRGRKDRRPAGRAARVPPTSATRALPPPAGEQRFRRGEILVQLAPGATQAIADQMLRRHRLVESEAAPIALLGATVRLWRAADPRDVAAIVRELAGESFVASVQPNYLYALQPDAVADAASADAGPPQYALEKLHVDAARALANGDKVLVAVVDTAVDETHPDLQGAVEARYDAIGGEVVTRAHGTSMAGAIAAHGRIEGVAPQVRLLTARAFDTTEAGAQGPTLSILKAIDWAAQQHAQVVNMSFAGPPDPAMHRILGAAFGKGIVLVAAAGNSGRNSAPLYPAADEKVLGVTATDADDRLFDNANVGHYVALSAPGVDVLLPAPGGAYALETGTSVSAALASGVAALILQRRPSLRPAALRQLLTSTARKLGASGHEADFGAGLVDALRALSEKGVDEPPAAIR